MKKDKFLNLLGDSIARVEIILELVYDDRIDLSLIQPVHNCLPELRQYCSEFAPQYVPSLECAWNLLDMATHANNAILSGKSRVTTFKEPSRHKADTGLRYEPTDAGYAVWKFRCAIEDLLAALNNMRGDLVGKAVQKRGRRMKLPSAQVLSLAKKYTTATYKKQKKSDSDVDKAWANVTRDSEFCNRVRWLLYKFNLSVQDTTKEAGEWRINRNPGDRRQLKHVIEQLRDLLPPLARDAKWRSSRDRKRKTR